MKKIILCMVILMGLLTITGCSNNTAYKSIVISNVDEDTRWEAISNYDITLEFENGKCVSENYRLEFLKESNAIVYGMEMEGQSYIEDYKQEGNIVTYKRTGINNEFYDRTIDEEIDLKLKTKKLFEKMREVLKDREKLILEMRYGLNGKKPKTQNEIAKMLGISRSYVSRIETKAINKLSKEFQD